MKEFLNETVKGKMEFEIIVQNRFFANIYYFGTFPGLTIFQNASSMK